MESLAGTTALVLGFALLACIHWLPLSTKFVATSVTAGVLIFAAWRLMLTQGLQAAAVAGVVAVAMAGFAGAMAPSIGRASLWATALAAGGTTLFTCIYVARLARQVLSR
jgi:hypothetical protein